MNIQCKIPFISFKIPSLLDVFDAKIHSITLVNKGSSIIALSPASRNTTLDSGHGILYNFKEEGNIIQLARDNDSYGLFGVHSVSNDKIMVVNSIDPKEDKSKLYYYLLDDITLSENNIILYPYNIIECEMVKAMTLDGMNNLYITTNKGIIYMNSTGQSTRCKPLINDNPNFLNFGERITITPDGKRLFVSALNIKDDINEREVSNTVRIYKLTYFITNNKKNNAWMDYNYRKVTRLGGDINLISSYGKGLSTNYSGDVVVISAPGLIRKREADSIKTSGIIYVYKQVEHKISDRLEYNEHRLEVPYLKGFTDKYKNYGKNLFITNDGAYIITIGVLKTDNRHIKSIILIYKYNPIMDTYELLKIFDSIENRYVSNLVSVDSYNNILSVMSVDDMGDYYVDVLNLNVYNTYRGS